MKHSKKISTIVAALGLILTNGAVASPLPQNLVSPNTIHIAQSSNEPVTVEGTLDNSSRQIEAGNYIDIYTFEGTEGDIIKITANGELQPSISVLDPDRNSILRLQSLADEPIVLELPQSGTYEIGAIAPEVGQTGDYQLSWQTVSPEEIAIEPFEVEDEFGNRSLTLDDGTLINIYRFSGVAGEVVTIELAADDFEPVLSVLDPSKNLIQTQQVVGDSASLTFSLPTTGTYQVGVLTPESNSTGSYRLNWQATSPEEIKIQPNTVEDQIDDQSLESDGGRLFNFYQFEASAGEGIAIELTSTTDDFNPILLLIDPNNNLVTKNQVTDSQAQIVETLPTTGTYSILVAAPEAGQTGSYQLSWQPISPDSQ